MSTAATLITVLPPTKPPRQFLFLGSNLMSLPSITKHKCGSGFLVSQNSRYFINGRTTRSHGNPKRDLAIYSSILPGPTGPPSNSWSTWVLGALFTIILPFFSHKWGPLYRITKQIEAVVDTVEHATEVIEKVAEQVEKVAEEVGDTLPEGGRLRDAIEFIENAAEKTAHGAHLAGEIIDKVEEVQDEVESFMGPVNEKANGTPNDKDTKIS